MDHNSISIIGRLTRDVTLKYTNTSKAVCSITIACNEMNNGVSFFDVDIWGKQAENCDKYLRKGSQVLIGGRLKQHTWQTPEGEKKSRIKITAFSVQFLRKPKSSGEESQQYTPKNESVSEPKESIESDINDTFTDSEFDKPIDNTDDIPF